MLMYFLGLLMHFLYIDKLPEGVPPTFLYDMIGKTPYYVIFLGPFGLYLDIALRKINKKILAHQLLMESERSAT